jgi:hypothetical protein
MIMIIKEELGIARPTIPYVNLVYNLTEDMIIEFFNDHTKPSVHDIQIGPKEIARIFNRESAEDFDDFPVQKINLKLHLKFFKRKNDSEKSFKVGGGAYGIEKLRKSQVSYSSNISNQLPNYFTTEDGKAYTLKLDLDVYIDYKNISFDDLKLLLIEYQAALLHEFNHFYEHINRHQGDRPKIDLSLTWVSEKNPKDILPKPALDLWKNFLTLIYLSEPHEVRAQISEMYAYVIKMDYNQIKSQPVWINSEKLKSFKSNNTFNILNSYVTSQSKIDSDYVLNVLLEHFKKSYLKQSKSYELTPSKKIMDVKSIQELMSLMEKRFEQAGETIQRGVAKLYVLKNDLEQDSTQSDVEDIFYKKK